jgi:phage-related protein (TIGR01555 family)
MVARAPLNQAKLQEKPRIRVPAGNMAHRLAATPQPAPEGKAFLTGDSFQNFISSVGLGTANQSSGSMYGFNPISRNHTQLEWMYRGSWLVKRIIDCVPDDMTREGVIYNTDLPPDETDELDTFFQDLGIWGKLNKALKWARLYGGAGCYIDIKGQRPDTPLRIETIGKDQFQGLVALDRWMVWPILNQVVQAAGPDQGKPMYYDVIADGIGLPRMRIHYSRFIRFEGMELPYWQALQENLWGCSVLEPLFDRLVAFDSSTTGAAQLVYKAHLRTYSVPGLRELIASGGPMYAAFLAQIQMMRFTQTNEGMTLIDGEDKFETHQYAFSGLSDMLIQFAQQLSGGAGIPLTRLFGQAPAGLNATGDGDIRNYNDMVKAEQNSRLRPGLTKVYNIASYSLRGGPLPENFGYSFRSLWQQTETEKATNAGSVVDSVVKVFQEGIINQKTALKELRQQSTGTGIFTNVTDEDIEVADGDPPEPPGAEALSAGMQQVQGAPGATPGKPTEPQKQMVN